AKLLLPALVRAIFDALSMQYLPLWDYENRCGECQLAFRARVPDAQCAQARGPCVGRVSPRLSGGPGCGPRPKGGDQSCDGCGVKAIVGLASRTRGKCS